MMRAIDADARSARKAYEDRIEAPMRTLGEKVAQATFAVRGASVPPDATFKGRIGSAEVPSADVEGRAVRGPRRRISLAPVGWRATPLLPRLGGGSA